MQELGISCSRYSVILSLDAKQAVRVDEPHASCIVSFGYYSGGDAKFSGEHTGHNCFCHPIKADRGLELLPHIGHRIAVVGYNDITSVPVDKLVKHINTVSPGLVAVHSTQSNRAVWCDSCGTLLKIGLAHFVGKMRGTGPAKKGTKVYKATGCIGVITSVNNAIIQLMDGRFRLMSTSETIAVKGLESAKSDILSLPTGYQGRRPSEEKDDEVPNTLVTPKKAVANAITGGLRSTQPMRATLNLGSPSARARRAARAPARRGT